LTTSIYGADTVREHKDLLEESYQLIFGSAGREKFECHQRNPKSVNADLAQALRQHYEILKDANPLLDDLKQSALIIIEQWRRFIN
jgi:hypothetical protein